MPFLGKLKSRRKNLSEKSLWIQQKKVRARRDPSYLGAPEKLRQNHRATV